MQFTWLSNSTDNPRGTFKLGWETTTGRVYYEDPADRRHTSHRPYTGASSGTSITQENIVLHSFEITDNLRIPIPVLRAIAASEDVDWTIPT